MERVRIPSLDGVRAVAISLVLLSHLIGTRGFPVTTTPLIDTGALGELQVGLIDADGRPVPGFSAEDCAPLEYNATGVPLYVAGMMVSALALR